ncbi:ABC transporter permease [Actinocorallia longicatena]|uniref:Transport permease protein n=1 Tax=Actinocorallia longicatena TaxID=111803 RepID=A0ABP6Q0E3_9ACTN
MTTVLNHTWYLTGRRLRAVSRQAAFLVIALVQPVIWLFLFGQLFRRVVDLPGFGGGSYLDYLIPGIVAMNAMSGSMWAGMGMMEEIERGTLNRFLVSPASRIGLINANVVELGVTNVVQAVIIMLLGWAGGARYPGGAAGPAVILLAAILVGVVFGSLSNAIGMLVREREAIIGLSTMLMLPLTFLSSAFMAPALMPDWMRKAAAANPLDWAVTAGREAMSADVDWGFVAIRCGGLLVLAAVCVALSVRTFRIYQKSV